MSWLKSIKRLPLVALVTFLRSLEWFLEDFLKWLPEGSLKSSLKSSLTVLVIPLLALLAFLRFLTEPLVDLAIPMEKKENNGPRLILPPGARIRDVLHVIYSPKTAERVFDQIIADMRLEWQEAMIHDQQWLARWVRIRGVLTVLITMVSHAVKSLGSIFKLVK